MFCLQHRELCIYVVNRKMFWFAATSNCNRERCCNYPPPPESQYKGGGDGPISKKREYRQYRVHYCGRFGGPGTCLSPWASGPLRSRRISGTQEFCLGESLALGFLKDTQSFQKSSIKEYAANPIMILMVQGRFLDEGLLEAMGTWVNFGQGLEIELAACSRPNWRSGSLLGHLWSLV